MFGDVDDIWHLTIFLVDYNNKFPRYPCWVSYSLIKELGMPWPDHFLPSRFGFLFIFSFVSKTFARCLGMHFYIFTLGLLFDLSPTAICAGCLARVVWSWDLLSFQSPRCGVCCRLFSSSLISVCLPVSPFLCRLYQPSCRFPSLPHSLSQACSQILGNIGFIHAWGGGVVNTIAEWDDRVSASSFFVATSLLLCRSGMIRIWTKATIAFEGVSQKANMKPVSCSNLPWDAFCRTIRRNLSSLRQRQGNGRSQECSGFFWLLSHVRTVQNPNNSRSFYGDGRSAASTSLQQQHSNSKKHYVLLVLLWLLVLIVQLALALCY